MNEHWYHTPTATDRFISEVDKKILGPNYARKLRSKGYILNSERTPSKAQLLKKELQDNKLNAPELIARIEQCDTVAEVNTILENEERVTVLKAGKKRIEELQQNNNEQTD